MPANIMMDFSWLKPKTDFFEAFMQPIQAGQQTAQQQMQNQKLMEELAFVTPRLEQELLQQQLINEMSGMKNQMTKESMPFNVPMMEQALQQAMAQVGLTGAQAGLAGSEAAMNRFRMQNPWLLAPTETGALMTMASGGAPGGMQAMGGQPGGNQMQQILMQKLMANLRTPEEQQQQSLNVKTQQDMLQESAMQSQMANQSAQDLEAFHGAYQQLGPLTSGPAVNYNPLVEWSPQYRDAKKYENRLINTAARLLQEGHINANDYEQQKLSNISIDMPPDTEKTIFNTIRAGLLRESEKNNFDYTASRMGLDPNLSKYLWTQYQIQRPTTTEGKPNYEYVESWQDYLQPDVIEKAVRGEQVRPRLGLDMSKDEFKRLPPERKEEMHRRIQRIQQLKQQE